MTSHRGGQGSSPGLVKFVVDKVALGQVFSEYFRLPYQLSFYRLLHTHHLSSGTGTVGRLVADVPSGLSLTSPQETKKLTISNTTVECLFILFFPSISALGFLVHYM
jgi:hypothetical protein